MKLMEKIGTWIVGILAVLGAIALYVLLTKDEAQKKVKEIENEIDDIEDDIKVKEEKLKEYLKESEVYGEQGAELDKQIEKAKKKKHNLDEKRKIMKDIFARYGD